MRKKIVALALMTVLAVTPALPLFGGAGTAIAVLPASNGAFAQPGDFYEDGLPRISPSSLASSIKTWIVNRMVDTIRLLWKLPDFAVAPALPPIGNAETTLAAPLISRGIGSTPWVTEGAS